MIEKLLILGVGSLTGFRFTEIIKNKFNIFGTYNKRNPNFDFIDSTKLDILNFSKLDEITSKINPDIIVNFTALNNVDYCETHKEDANKINNYFIKHLSKISDKLNSKLVHVSTDSVFDGTQNKPYDEKDTPNPPNVYGLSKLNGEKSVLNYSNNLVIRASVLYGWLPKHVSSIISSSMKSTNFVQWLIGELLQNKQVKIINDEISSPIIADDLANSIFHLIKSQQSGVFHSAPPIRISRYDFSKKLISFLDLDESLIIPITTNELGRKVNTGKNKCLNSKKLQNIGYTFLDLDDSFKLIKRQMNN